MGAVGAILGGIWAAIKWIAGALWYPVSAYTGYEAVAVAITKIVFWTAVSYAVSSLLYEKPESPRSTTGGLILNSRSPNDPVPVIYGTMRVGGTQVFMHSDAVFNTRLHIVQTISEGEIDSILQVKLNDEDISNWNGWAGYSFKNGAADQTAIAGIPLWDDALRNTAHIYVQLIYDLVFNRWAGMPLITTKVKGIKVYDPRTETTEWSNNPAVCIYDFMRNKRYGVGIDEQFIDTTSIIDVANTLDDEGYEMNTCIVARENALDTLNKLLASCRTMLIWSQGKFRLKFLEYEAPVESFDESDILADSFSFNLPSIQDHPNTLIVRYVNEDSDYIQEEFKIHNPDALAANEEENSTEIVLSGVTDYETAYKCGVYQLERRLLDPRFTFTAGPKAIVLEAGDVIEVTHSLPGWVDQLVRIEGLKHLSSNEIQLEVVLETESLYDATLNIVDHTQWSTTLIDPTDVPLPPDNVQFTEENYVMKDNTYTRLKGTWEYSVSLVDYVEVWISRDLTNWFMHTKTTGAFTIEPVYEGETYYIKLRSVSIYGSKAELDDLDYYTRTISGVADPPNNVTGFNIGVADDKLSMGWNAVTNTDLLYYEIRWGASWGTAIPIAQVKATKKTFTGVKPGTHTFLIKAKDTLNNYSQTPGQKTVTIQNPIGYAQETFEASNFWDSTSYWNVEYYDDPVHGWVLSVCDSTSSLSGWWESPIYDLGSNDFRKLWNIFSWASDTPGGTWLAGAGDFDWEDVFDIGETWLQQFAGAPVGTIEMTLYFSEDGIDWDSFTGFELVSHECKGRYFYYRVTLTNVSDEVEILLKPVTFYSWMRT